MGKVLTTFVNTFPGAISRNVDDIVISMTNVSEADIPFGAPVFLDAANKGAVGWASGAGMSTFLGFATRIGVKTPEVYASNEAAYKPGDVMSVLVRGSICVELDSGTPVVGAGVYLNASTGKITATSTDNTSLTNVKFRQAVGTNGCVEVVVTERNIQ